MSWPTDWIRYRCVNSLGTRKGDRWENSTSLLDARSYFCLNSWLTDHDRFEDTLWQREREQRLFASSWRPVLIILDPDSPSNSCLTYTHLFWSRGNRSPTFTVSFTSIPFGLITFTYTHTSNNPVGISCRYFTLCASLAMGWMDCSGCNHSHYSRWRGHMCNAQDACEQKSSEEKNSTESGNERRELLCKSSRGSGRVASSTGSERYTDGKRYSWWRQVTHFRHFREQDSTTHRRRPHSSEHQNTVKQDCTE